MAVLSLKPHKIEYLVIENGYEDSNGDYHEGSSHWEGNIPCDAVPSGGKANEIQFEDGSVHRYSYTLYLSNAVKRFEVGERIRVEFHDGRIREFEVLGFQRYQLQSKLWV